MDNYGYEETTYEDGVKTRIFESYVFPYGNTYIGEILSDEMLIYKTHPQDSIEKCKQNLIEVLNGLIASHEKELSRLKATKEKLNNEQI